MRDVIKKIGKMYVQAIKDEKCTVARVGISPKNEEGRVKRRVLKEVLTKFKGVNHVRVK